MLAYSYTQNVVDVLGELFMAGFTAEILVRLEMRVPKDMKMRLLRRTVRTRRRARLILV